MPFMMFGCGGSDKDVVITTTTTTGIVGETTTTTTTTVPPYLNVGQNVIAKPSKDFVIGAKVVAKRKIEGKDGEFYWVQISPPMAGPKENEDGKIYKSNLYPNRRPLVVTNSNNDIVISFANGYDYSPMQAGDLIESYGGYMKSTGIAIDKDIPLSIIYDGSQPPPEDKDAIKEHFVSFDATPLTTLIASEMSETFIPPSATDDKDKDKEAKDKKAQDVQEELKEKKKKILQKIDPDGKLGPIDSDETLKKFDSDPDENAELEGIGYKIYSTVKAAKDTVNQLIEKGDVTKKLMLLICLGQLQFQIKILLLKH